MKTLYKNQMTDEQMFDAVKSEMIYNGDYVTETSWIFGKTLPVEIKTALRKLPDESPAKLMYEDLSAKIWDKYQHIDDWTERLTKIIQAELGERMINKFPAELRDIARQICLFLFCKTASSFAIWISIAGADCSRPGFIFSINHLSLIHI